MYALKVNSPLTPLIPFSAWTNRRVINLFCIVLYSTTVTGQWVGAVSTGKGFGHRYGRNSKICTTLSPITRTAGTGGLVNGMSCLAMDLALYAKIFFSFLNKTRTNLSKNGPLGMLAIWADSFCLFHIMLQTIREEKQQRIR